MGIYREIVTSRGISSYYVDVRGLFLGEHLDNKYNKNAK